MKRFCQVQNAKKCKDKKRFDSMEYYFDITTDQFEKIRDHETLDLYLSKAQTEKVTGKEEGPFFKVGDGLKLYHPSDFPEALRVEVKTVDEPHDPDQIHLTIRLNEWMMSFPEDRRDSDGFGGLF